MSEDVKDVKEVKETKETKKLSTDEELKQLELEARRLELLERQANLQDMRERLAERELKRETTRQRARTNGATLAATASEIEKQQKRCNHKKGGDGAAGVIGGRGNDQQYAIFRHKMMNGDIWVRCLRCGKNWKPPVKGGDFWKKQYPKAKTFEDALIEYNDALEFSTRNVQSSGIVLQFSDGGEHFREVTKDVKI